MNLDDLEKTKREAIWQFVNDLDLFRLRRLVLTQGRRASLLLRELVPLEAAAKLWASSSPSESEIGTCKEQAEAIMRELFACVQAPSDLFSPAAAMQAPADYDDSEQALGRQRAAQLERLAEYERKRAKPFEDF
jgi:hypothetical protein